MLNYLYLTGDCHGNFGKFCLFKPKYPEQTGVILLGDTGANYYKNWRDDQSKAILNSRGYKIYLVRGNHEDRPENISTMKMIMDEDLMNPVYVEDDFPNIRYLIDGLSYTYKDKKILVLGGAYSVDKYYRLQKGWNWFKDEQLSEKERDSIFNSIKGQSFDFVLSHTCPYEFQPTELFLSVVDQSTVDNSMEHWLDDVKNNIDYKFWIFGHYHDDMIIRPNVFMLFHKIIDIDAIDICDGINIEIPEDMKKSKYFSYC
jgi:3-oxoacid CoA-transferase subunit A